MSRYSRCHSVRGERVGERECEKEKERDGVRFGGIFFRGSGIRAVREKSFGTRGGQDGSRAGGEVYRGDG